MTLSDIQQLYGASVHAKALINILENKSEKHVFLQGLLASAAPTFFASIADRLPHPTLFVLDDAESAGYFYNDLLQFLPPEQVLIFPSGYRRSAKYGQRDAANEILRTEVLAQLQAYQRGSLYIVTSPEALAERVVARETIAEQMLTLSVGQEIEPTEVEHRLQEMGFTQVDYVYEPGQFALRGSIIDVYSFSSEWPLRIDFFDVEIDSIRTFELDSQLSREKKQQVEIVPAFALTKQEKVSLLNYLPAESLVVAKDADYTCDTVDQIYSEGFLPQVKEEQLAEASAEQKEAVELLLNREVQLIDGQSLAEEIRNFQLVELKGPTSKDHLSAHAASSQTISFQLSSQPLFHKNFSLLYQALAGYRDEGYQLCILAENPKQHGRLRDIFAQEQFAQEAVPEQQLQFWPIEKTLHEGFVDHDLRLCLFTDHQIFDRFHKYTLRSDVARQGKMALSMKELRELEVGDYLVHIDHGIGKFGGLVRVPAGNSYQEVIRIIYQRGDIVDVSIHSLYKISKYRNAESGEPPRLSTLGTGAWERLKERTKKRMKDIARDLIRLYARQRQAKGFAFSPDGYLQHELEASFMYEDTPDQLTATQEVKHDMEAQKPMDRLVCGDVGFGKTEVAIRAAFKAAADSKQVAVLVPTTVLAFQHFQTFSERLKDLPVRVDYLTRARTAKQVKALLADLEAGRIDILVGTHKLIGKQVKWKDLGLLIIDEEQKFGVAVKEKLRMLKSNVDTLTLSATPIPRTLQFSLMGARDMSVIRTAPPNRYPIYTELATFGSEVIVDAINFEMSRNGQVYFVNSRINNLYEMGHLIQKHIPDCRIAIGHGQMPPEELEKIILGFINYDYDVLLSTTIVENGIDIPNANTIIINDAHRFGLSDLHQMRGRVGRSNRKAFCYLLAPPKSVLTPEARRRLEALENFSELGSGFNLALQDLDIRGAGNLLGAEQSGFMEDMGFEMYEKILKQAMAELRNEPDLEFTPDAAPNEGSLTPDAASKGDGSKNARAQHTTTEKISSPASRNEVSGEAYIADCAVESDLEMYFPDTYVPGSSERLLLYRELENVLSDRDLQLYRQRLEDRFGPIPPQGEELLEVVALRRVGKRLGLEKISLRQGRVIVQFVHNQQSPYYQSETFGRILNYAARNYRRCQLKEVGGRRVMHIANVSSAAQANALLREMEQY